MSKTDPVQQAAKDTPSGDKLFGRYTIYGVDGEHREPYMTRYWFGRLRLHIFHRGDNDPDPHDHPWGFWTFPLTSYVEEVIDERFADNVRGPDEMLDRTDALVRRRQIVRAFRFHYRPATHTHRVLGRYNGPPPREDFELYAEGRALFPCELYGHGKIITLVWRGSGGRKWGFLKNRDGQWCWVPWKEYVFGGGKHAPCEPEIKPHYYWPSFMHMGDCSVCGNTEDSPLHTKPEPPARTKLL